MSFKLQNKWLNLRVTNHGGAILDVHLNNGRALLRPFQNIDRNLLEQPSQPFNILETGCFPLLPLGNRVKGNSFLFENELIRLKKNSHESPLYLHGDGWLSIWDVVNKTESSICLALEFKYAKDSPFAYKAIQNIVLEKNSFQIDLEIINQGRTLPFGLGMHPYFRRTNDVQLKAHSNWYLPIDDENIPIKKIKIPKDRNFSSFKNLVSGMDNCFTEWNSKAEIIYPSDKLKLELLCSDNLNNFLIYTPSTEEYFCFEPMTHAPNDVNTNDLGGMKVLKKDEVLKAKMQVIASDL